LVILAFGEVLMAKITVRLSLWFLANELGFLQKDAYGISSFSGKTFVKEIANGKNLSQTA